MIQGLNSQIYTCVKGFVFYFLFVLRYICEGFFFFGKGLVINKLIKMI